MSTELSPPALGLVRLVDWLQNNGNAVSDLGFGVEGGKLQAQRVAIHSQGKHKAHQLAFCQFPRGGHPRLPFMAYCWRPALLCLFAHGGETTTDSCSCFQACARSL
jgi:hypothetical protein